MVSHPLCHFSSAAARAIESHAILSEIFQSSATWIAPPDRHLGTAEIASWNAQHPRSKHRIAYSRTSWPELTGWATPTFHFMKDGKVMEIVAGWPEEGNGQALLEAAERVRFVRSNPRAHTSKAGP